MLEVDSQILGLNLPERRILLGIGSQTVGWDLPKRREMMGADCWRGEGGRVGVQWLSRTRDGWTVVVGRR